MTSEHRPIHCYGDHEDGPDEWWIITDGDLRYFLERATEGETVEEVMERIRGRAESRDYS